MPSLPKDLRSKLEKAVLAARDEATEAARAALTALGVGDAKKPDHLDAAGEALRRRLRARGRQVGDLRRADDSQETEHLVQECAYEHWHRMLFARFLAENELLIHPEMSVAVSLDECEELAREEGLDRWELGARYAQQMLPEVFRQDDPVLQLRLPTESRNRLTAILTELPPAVFTASDALGWTYQFWQTGRKKEVNESGVKIGADELPPVTQLFTEDYMVDFLLDNTLGAWHSGKVLAANPEVAQNAQTEDELRQAVALPGCPWKYLRFIKAKDGQWTPAAGTFDGWPKSAAAIRALDPCMGSGHFVVAMFERLVALRLAEEKLDEATAVAAVIRDNLFGLEIDPRCTQIGAFNLALAAWRRIGHCPLPGMNLACSGLAPNTREADWLALAGDNQKICAGMERLYRLFSKAAVLGSLINPRAGEGDLLVAAFHELQPLLEKALAQEAKDEATYEMVVTARGLAKAAEILASQFTLVATNVPFLRRGKQCAELQNHIEECFTEGRADLATAFLQRCFAFLEPYATSACVSQQHFLYLGSYEDFRLKMLTTARVHFFVRLGPGAFETITGENVTVALSCVTRSKPIGNESLSYYDAQTAKAPAAKAELILRGELTQLEQDAQINNPNSRIGFSHDSEVPLLQTKSGAFVGLQNGDTPRFILFFWEVPRLAFPWDAFQLTSDETIPYGGRDGILRWEQGQGVLASASYARVQGTEAWGRKGVAVRNTVPLPVTLYSGDLYDQSSTAIIPEDPEHLPALWAFCSSDEFFPAVQLVDGKRNKTNQTYLKIPFDLERWQSVAADEYPHGLPKPFSSDPTQWLFNGHPKGSDHPLQVAVARLVGFRWPRQTGSSFPDCSAIDTDGLERCADDDGIVCFSQVRADPPAATRLRELLSDAYGSEWGHALERKLIAQTGSKAVSLEDWLVNDFFAQHCDIFQNRPFVWHIWDGRKDGFNVLVNYHKLTGPDGAGARTLESLTYAYLGDWITRRKDALAQGEAGAEDRYAAAQELQAELKHIAAGEPPYDLFIRWKPLDQQPIGWEPDINDGVRLNIRPFLTSDLSRGKKGTGLFRSKPGSSLKWTKDRGNEPSQPKEDFPWFWTWDEKTVDFTGNSEFDGNRWNDCHYTTAFKRAAREKKSNA